MILYEYADFSVASYQGDMRIKHSLGGSMSQARFQAKMVKNENWDKHKNSRQSEWFLYLLTLCKDMDQMWRRQELLELQLQCTELQD